MSVRRLLCGCAYVRQGRQVKVVRVCHDHDRPSKVQLIGPGEPMSVPGGRRPGDVAPALPTRVAIPAPNPTPSLPPRHDSASRPFSLGDVAMTQERRP